MESIIKIMEVDKMPKKRERLDVIYDILHAVGNSKLGPTRLLYASNLSPEMFKNYINELSDSDLIIEITEKNKKKYSLTEKGFLFIEQYKSFRRFVDNLGL